MEVVKVVEVKKEQREQNDSRVRSLWDYLTLDDHIVVPA